MSSLPNLDEFWVMAAQDAPERCWPWAGSVQRIGYGVFRKTVAHRVAYELAKGPIPAGLEIDHLCGNRACVNPAHLEAVTRRENIMRSHNFAAVNARKTHCPQGYPYSGANLHIRLNGDRRCRTCVRAGNDRITEQRRRNARLRAERGTA